MTPPTWLRPRAWILIPFCCLAFVAFSDYARLQRVAFVSNVAREDASIDPASSTGYADGKRWLIVPEHNNPTYQWVEETQLMLARGDWRVRTVDYENSPVGRSVHAASPYRWWLSAIAGVDHAFSGKPLGFCVERAALFADPLLHLILLAAATLFVARRFGAFPASLLAVGLATAYPLAGTFLPGVANDFGLGQICSFWSILLLLAGSRSGPDTRRLFIGAGIAGGLGLWLGASDTLPVLGGIGIGGVLAAVAGRKAATRGGGPAAAILPWGAWSMAGATTSLLAYLAEYFPNHMEPELRVNYPLYGVAWLGLGGLLMLVAAGCRSGRPISRKRDILSWVLAVLALVSLPVAILRTGDHAFLAGDLLSSRLTNLPDGVVAGNVAAWAARDGVSGAFVATVIPILLVLTAAGLLIAGRTAQPNRASIAIGLGPVVTALSIAAVHLRVWTTFDLAALALLVVAAGDAPRWIWAALTGAAAFAGIVQLAPPAASGTSDFKFTRAEVEGLYERALAQWIADHAGPQGATVLVPPLRTSSFCFYGGLRGLGTPNWENREGLSSTFRIVNSTRPDETLALVNQRGVTHIILPSWDTDLDDFARMGLKQPTDSFIYALHQTDGGIFNWLRALPYNQPVLNGFNEQSVLVLEVTDETDPATLRGRLVEYLVEMHRLDQAAYAARALLRYPADLGALVSLAQLAKAADDGPGFAKTFAALVSNLSSGSDRTMKWDRRVSLAVVLEIGGREDLARKQVDRCLESIDDAKIRSLTTGSLYHLLVLLKHFGADISPPPLKALSLKLLPTELRERL